MGLLDSIENIFKVNPKKAASKTSASKRKKRNTKGDPVDTILRKMIEMEQIRISEVQETILLTATGYSRTDSKGYRNAMKKLIKELKYLERTTQNKKTIYKLTSIGRNYLLSTGALVIPDAPKSNGEYHA